eukprot:scaffold64430_cov47-Phaeocystis_antarctica.AAC.1
MGSRLGLGFGLELGFGSGFYLDVLERLLERVAHAGLRRQVDHPRDAPLLEDAAQQLTVAHVALDDRVHARLVRWLGSGSGLTLGL